MGSCQSFAYKDLNKYYSKILSMGEYYFFNHLASPFLYINLNFLKLHPNILSVFSGIFAFISMFYFLQSDFLLGGVFYGLSYIFDCIDGATARALGKTSKLGVVLEVWTDSFRLIGVTFSIAWTLYNTGDNPMYLLLALIWAVSFGAGLWINQKALESYKEEPKNPGRLSMKEISPDRYLCTAPMWMDMEIIGFFLLPLLGLMTAGFFIVTVGSFLLTLGLSIYYLVYS